MLHLLTASAGISITGVQTWGEIIYGFTTTQPARRSNVDAWTTHHGAWVDFDISKTHTHRAPFLSSQTTPGSTAPRQPMVITPVPARCGDADRQGAVTPVPGCSTARAQIIVGPHTIRLCSWHRFGEVDGSGGGPRLAGRRLIPYGDHPGSPHM